MEKLTNSKFFSINMGHIIIVMTQLIVVAMYFGKQDTILSQEANTRAAMERKIQSMDIDGPTYGKILKVQVDSMDRRMIILENQLPRIITVMADMNNLTHAIDEIKADIKEIKNRSVIK